VQLGGFLRSDTHKWEVAYCKLLPQTLREWQALSPLLWARKNTFQQRCAGSKVPRLTGFASRTLETQLAALHHLLDQLPELEYAFMQHVNATICYELGGQLEVLPPLGHATACQGRVEVLHSGRRHLKLDILSVRTLLAAFTVLPQMQGLDSLILTLANLGYSFLSCSFLRCMTSLKEIELKGRKSDLISQRPDRAAAPRPEWLQ
jgi:hypothetical protein